MPSLDSLPGDQHAVLQLVLGRGRSYDEIARLLSIDRSAVRARALAAARMLGPATAVSGERQALIADYLLGQLDETQRDEARRVLAESAGEHEWARALVTELTPLATAPLPEIPASAATAVAEPQAEPTPAPAWPDTEPAPSSPPAEAPPPPAEKRRRWRRRRETAAGQSGDGPRSSRLGGLILIVVAIAAIVVIVVLIVRHSSSDQPVASTPATSSSPATTADSSTSSATTSTTSTTTAKALAAINLSPPPGSHSKAIAAAEILRQGSAEGIAIVAQHVPPNKTHPPNAYAVWLYNSPTDAHILGFVNPGVGSSGRFSTATVLPANASHYKQVIVTLETSAKPKKPGPIILQGPLTGL